MTEELDIEEAIRRTTELRNRPEINYSDLRKHIRETLEEELRVEYLLKRFDELVESLQHMTNEIPRVSLDIPYNPLDLKNFKKRVNTIFDELEAIEKELHILED